MASKLINAVKREIKKAAEKQLRTKVLSVSHVKPRAYCIVRDRTTAVFAVPPCDAEPQIQKLGHCEHEHIHSYPHGTRFPEDLKSGEWCSLAYVSTEISGEPFAIRAVTA